MWGFLFVFSWSFLFDLLGSWFSFTVSMWGFDFFFLKLFLRFNFLLIIRFFLDLYQFLLRLRILFFFLLLFYWMFQLRLLVRFIFLILNTTFNDFLMDSLIKPFFFFFFYVMLSSDLSMICASLSLLGLC